MKLSEPVKSVRVEKWGFGGVNPWLTSDILVESIEITDIFPWHRWVV